MTEWKITRRRLLQSTGIFSGAVMFGAPFISKCNGAVKTPKLEIERIQYVSNQPDIYYGWPTIGRNKKTKELFVSCSGGREEHVCPFGRVDLFRSRDDGKTWSWPQTLCDGPIDDRDSGILVTSTGTLLVTTFTSVYYKIALDKELERRKIGRKLWSDEKLERWLAADRRIDEEQKKKAQGYWMLRSTDDGISWSIPYRVPTNSPHGPVEGFNGRLLYFGCGGWKDGSFIGVFASIDDGKSWQGHSGVPYHLCTDNPSKRPFWNELHGLELEPGKFLLHIRNNDNRETWQTESNDDGKTWSKPHSIEVWGLPSHLLKLRDGRILMSYGYRRDPYRNHVRISEDAGSTWSEPLFLSEEGPQRDLGYPSSVQLDDDSLLTVWYEKCPGDKNSSIRMAHWRLS